ncbi:putative phage tail protein [Neisseria sp. Ec49-e6-T10]|uniref:putative phage tail protein n=1 Tax=Neisseria sp. Ec49-e6-T10 TaxID=3140744 RepID=UPI003EBFF5EE
MALKFEPVILKDEYKDGQYIVNDHLPKGRIWEAFGVVNTSNYAVSAAFGAMVALLLKYIAYLKKELNPFTTEDLISAWEESCGLPDHCTIYFSQTLDQRRLQVVYRIRRKPIITTDEIEQVIKELTGFDVKIIPRRKSSNILNNAFDGGASFDAAPFSTNKSDRFTFDVYINYEDENSFDGEYPLDGDYLLDGQARPTILECLINKIKPANTVAVYHYSRTMYMEN